MYSLPHFKAINETEVLQFMYDHPFVLLAGCDENNTPVATQIPVLITQKDGRLYLEGHIMKNTDHHQAFAHNSSVLAVFTGAQAYVSASWYKMPQQASTWNYMAVQVKGTLTFLNETRLIDILKRTTAHFENNTRSPASFENLPTAYVESLSKNIIAFEIKITSLEHTFKLSQNKDKETYQNIIDQLTVSNDSGANHIADEMRKGMDNIQ